MRKVGLSVLVLLAVAAVAWLARDLVQSAPDGELGERAEAASTGGDGLTADGATRDGAGPALTAAERTGPTREALALEEARRRAAAAAAARAAGMVPFGGTLVDASGGAVAGARVGIVGAEGQLALTSDERGAFRGEIQPGRYDLLIVVPGRGALHLEGYVIDGAARADLELRLDPPATVTVLLERAGQGIADAPIDLKLAAWRWAGGAPAFTKSTDAYGKVTFADLVQGTYDLSAQIPQGPALNQPLPVKGDAEVHVVVPDGIELFGTVTDAAARRPVADAKVTIATALGKGPRLECTIGTAADGTFRFLVPKGAALAFSVTATGYAPWPHARDVRRVIGSLKGLAGTEPVQRDVELVLGGAVTGRLTQDQTGLPLPGVTLAFKPRRGEVLRTTSAEEGRFSVPNLNAGRYDVVVETPGWFPLRPLSVEVPEQATEPIVFDAVLVGSRVVQGLVLASGEVPAKGARVWLTGGGQILRSARAAGRPLETFTGPEGRWTIADVPPSVDVAVRAALGPLEATPVGISATHPPAGDVRLLLATTVDLHGRVTEPGGGEPVAGATVRVLPRGAPGGRDRRSATTDAEGRWRVDDLIPGDYDVLPARGDYLPATPRAVTLAPGAELERVDVVLDPGLTLAGWAVDAQGRGLAAAVSAEGTGEDGKAVRRSGTAGLNGAFRLTGFVRGTYRLRIAAVGFVARVVENLAGGEDRLRIELAPTPPTGS